MYDRDTRDDGYVFYSSAASRDIYIYMIYIYIYTICTSVVYIYI
jgi:hypothetical protein